MAHAIVTWVPLKTLGLATCTFPQPRFASNSDANLGHQALLNYLSVPR